MSRLLTKSKMRHKTNNIIFFWIFFGFFVILSVNNVVASEQDNDTLINTSNVIEFVNKERTERDIKVLQENELLDIVAQKKLENMMEEDYFAHTSPDGVDPWEWFLQSGYDFAYAGENLATEYTDVVKQHEAWMNSPKHKQNILDERFTYTGVAVGQKEVDGKNVILTVQVFATPSSVSITSPNFTPETFEVPDALFYKGVKDISTPSQDYVENNPLFVKAGTINDPSVSQVSQRGSHVKILAWIFIGLLIVVVFWLEYHIFARKPRK